MQNRIGQDKTEKDKETTINGLFISRNEIKQSTKTFYSFSLHIILRMKRDRTNEKNRVIIKKMLNILKTNKQWQISKEMNK